jgi:hypothetical protein
MKDNVISLSELIEQRLLKQQEIDYYKETLDRLEKKVVMLSREVDITTLIIDMIEQERVLTLGEKQSKIIKLEDKVEILQLEILRFENMKMMSGRGVVTLPMRIS